MSKISNAPGSDTSTVLFICQTFERKKRVRKIRTAEKAQVFRSQRPARDRPCRRAVQGVGWHGTTLTSRHTLSFWSLPASDVSPPWKLCKSHRLRVSRTVSSTAPQPEVRGGAERSSLLSLCCVVTRAILGPSKDSAPKHLISRNTDVVSGGS